MVYAGPTVGTPTHQPPKVTAVVVIREQLGGRDRTGGGWAYSPDRERAEGIKELAGADPPPLLWCKPTSERWPSKCTYHFTELDNPQKQDFFLVR